MEVEEGGKFKRPGRKRAVSGTLRNHWLQAKEPARALIDLHAHRAFHGLPSALLPEEVTELKDLWKDLGGSMELLDLLMFMPRDKDTWSLTQKEISLRTRHQKGKCSAGGPKELWRQLIDDFHARRGGLSCNALKFSMSCGRCLAALSHAPLLSLHQQGGQALEMGRPMLLSSEILR